MAALLEKLRPYGIPEDWDATKAFSNANLALLIGGTEQDIKDLVVEFQDRAQDATVKLYPGIQTTDPKGVIRRSIWQALNRELEWLGKFEFSTSAQAVACFEHLPTPAGLGEWQKVFRREIEARVRQKIFDETPIAQRSKTPATEPASNPFQSTTDNGPQTRVQAITSNRGPPADFLHWQYLTVVVKKPKTRESWTVACRHLIGSDIGYHMMDENSVIYDELVLRLEEIAGFDRDLDRLFWIEESEWQEIDDDLTLRNALTTQRDEVSSLDVKIYINGGEVGQTVTGSPARKRQRTT
ncbi:hypothetical protein LTR56_018867 [Elasticomyces elasticus]|nr:hypothetical protein LTR56_018867 [Elasticomyces elasticus]KAK3638010.1 hypothetical protein LTR22_017972 [Elasticomyces elasticus]KAK4912952.1 hypothetical protein LTR49_018702 [Elasticomyces elasticus]KAK5749848.1 hypothetical protein LTS12_020066 [Elasticomyces elasticus]